MLVSLHMHVIQQPPCLDQHCHYIRPSLFQIEFVRRHLNGTSTGRPVLPSQQLNPPFDIEDIPDVCGLPEQSAMWLQHCTRNKLCANFLPENRGESIQAPPNL